MNANQPHANDGEQSALPTGPHKAALLRATDELLAFIGDRGKAPKL